MPDGGTLSIDIRSKESRREGPRALISVTDTGLGMDDDTIERAFDPFFTTKETGKGTGLGLATVLGIVEQSGGQVSLDSAPGKGTTVSVFLPTVAPGDLSRSDRAMELPKEGGQETILLAEDEEAVSGLMVRVLQEKGYEVLSARHGREALRIWRQRKDDVDLLLTDVVMPEMGGADLARELRRSGYTKPILFASGYTNDALAQLTRLDGEIDLLEKPFVAAELVGRVRLALDRS
jgi:CheY-like chemotaxis protein